MICKVFAAGLKGVDSYRLEIEVDAAYGLMSMLIVGLPDKAVNESRERVQSAILNSGYQYPNRKVTVNLAPADIKKDGTAWDLPIALGLLAVNSQLDLDRLAKIAAVGELALDGRVRPVRGALPMALELRRRGHPRLLMPAENAEEAGVVEGIDIIPITHLTDAVGVINGTLHIEPHRMDVHAFFERPPGVTDPVDFSDVRGQESAKRAAEVAAAGGHNLLLLGAPGGGKTMIAKRMPQILPTLTLDEALETTRLHSVAGLTSKDVPLITVRPFRAPHHTVSDAGLIGGGSIPQPGEVSLAHHGVLFLDELPEFARRTLEVLRQPLEDGYVTIGRASMTSTFPAEFMLVASMNPCPCGFRGHPKKQCVCSERQIENYRGRLSGPLLDRIDMHLEVPPVDFDDLHNRAPGEPSKDIRARVQAARDLQATRFRREAGDESRGRMTYCNARMTEAELRTHCALSRSSESLLRSAMDSMTLSARAYSRILKLARTIADLDQAADIGEQHLSEAIQYRHLDRPISETV
ncbi:MAG: YifB family Mg chelatase-like AAA ATPase [Planctomycetota bacterium]